MPTTVPAGSLQATRHRTESLPDGVEVTFDDRDHTRPFLVLHGGGGVATVSAFGELLAARTHSRVLVPTHPGFAGTPKPASLSDTAALAAAYVALLDQLDLVDVTVIGNSFGGWVAAEIALLGSPRVSGAIIVDGIGIEVEGHPTADVSRLTPAELAQRSFHDVSRAPRPAPGAPAPKPDVAALIAYTGPTMSDPGLLGRLAGIDLPVRVLWGVSDGIVDPDYGRAYAAAIPGAAFTELPFAGHLPLLEAPEELLPVIWNFGD